LLDFVLSIFLQRTGACIAELAESIRIKIIRKRSDKKMKSSSLSLTNSREHDSPEFLEGF